jgi:hypothetical protein
MSPPLIEEYEDRRRQVRHYLAIVIAAEKAAARTTSAAHQRRLLTLRAGTFLLLYNLVESSLRSGVDSIHDNIMTHRAPFERLIPCLRKEAVARFKKHANPALHATLLPAFPTSFVAVGMAESLDFSGNVDARLIRELAQTYGFSSTAPSETWGGSDLLTIKSIRNDLAHGKKSFEEVGRDYPANELLKISRRSTSFVRAILNNILLYLDDKDYLVA